MYIYCIYCNNKIKNLKLSTNKNQPSSAISKSSILYGNMSQTNVSYAICISSKLKIFPNSHIISPRVTIYHIQFA